MRLLSAEEAKKLDKWAIEELGIPIEALMESAGLNLVMAMEKEWGPLSEKKVSLFCGKGHNGGDGLVAARHLANQGCWVRIFLPCPRAELAKLTSRQLETCFKMGMEIQEIEKEADLDRFKDEILSSNLLVDALLGTGTNGAVSGPLGKIIEQMNATGLPIVSADLPSGVNASTGGVEGAAIKAALTVTFAAAKRGLMVHPGAAHAGKLVVADIGIPPFLWGPGGCFLNRKQDLQHLVPLRPPAAHKRQVGACLVVAGSLKYSGAALLAARGCQRGGAGLVHLAVPGCLASLAQGALPEVIVHGLGGPSRESFEAGDLESLRELARHVQSVVLGPGLGESPSARELAQALYAALEQPLVADADALNALSQLSSKPLAKGKRILTPHHGEAARLAGVPPQEIEKDRLQWAQKLSNLTHAVILLKGPLSLVADPSGFVFVNTTGNPALASAGSGDVLSGLLGALLAQGLPPLDAARLGVYLHGAAADRLAAVKGEIGVLAGEVAENIPNSMKDLIS